MNQWIMAHPYLFVFMTCYCVTVIFNSLADAFGEHPVIVEKEEDDYD